MKICYYIISLLLLISCQSSIEENSKINAKNNALNSLFENIEKMESAPQDSLYRGLHTRGKWKPSTAKQQEEDYRTVMAYIDSLEAIRNDVLNEQEAISKKVMLIKLRNQAANYQYKNYLIPFNAEGGFYNQMTYVLPNLPFNSTEDYLQYLDWLPQYNKVLLENMKLLRTGLKEGIVAPKIIVKNTLNLLKPWIQEDSKKSIFYQPIGKLPADIDETDKSDILNRGELEINKLISTYKQLFDFFEGEYYEEAPVKPGISFIPKGKEYYENRVKHFSTLQLSADSVHALGLSEVARIRKEMDKIIEEVQFEGSFADFLSFLRTDERFYPKSEQELLNYASWLSKKAEGQLPKLFNTLYTLPFTVEPVPSNIAPTYTAGRFVGGSWETQRAGIYWVNTYNLPSRTLYTLPALTLHEAVPGHHLQNAIASELKDIPKFRNNYYISAFGEGWGLYSEFLGEEMGMYETPYDLFGRYTYEMWRACRLVVDTGIHYKGWSRQEALDYMASNTALSMHEITTEIDRYIGWPGQALSYKIGEIKIRALRAEAEMNLGNAFDVGEFHEVVLKNGSIPLEVLEEQVAEYVLSKK